MLFRAIQVSRYVLFSIHSTCFDWLFELDQYWYIKRNNLYLPRPSCVDRWNENEEGAQIWIQMIEFWCHTQKECSRTHATLVYRMRKASFLYGTLVWLNSRMRLWILDNTNVTRENFKQPSLPIVLVELYRVRLYGWY
jgi:hypothetical protein